MFTMASVWQAVQDVRFRDALMTGWMSCSSEMCLTMQVSNTAVAMDLSDDIGGIFTAAQAGWGCSDVMLQLTGPDDSSALALPVHRYGSCSLLTNLLGHLSNSCVRLPSTSLIALMHAMLAIAETAHHGTLAMLFGAASLPMCVGSRLGSMWSRSFPALCHSFIGSVDMPGDS